MNTNDEKYYLAYFLTKFYDMCDGVECSNITLDEFYDEFPIETHSFIQRTIKKMENEVRNA